VPAPFYLAPIVELIESPLMTHISRRQFLQMAASAAVATPAVWLGDQSWGDVAAARAGGETWVDDIHSGLNSTHVSKVLKLHSAHAVQETVQRALKSGTALAVCGARHAGGGQQFLTDHALVDCTSMANVLSFDQERGLLTMQPGIRWSGVLEFLHAGKIKNDKWCVRQRPTGNDRLTLGGTLSANAHGQGLNFPPLIDDIESLTIVDGRGELLTVSRQENADLFPLVIGGYGMFGLVTAVTLRLVPLKKLRCITSELPIGQLATWRQAALEEGAVYGSLQVNVDDRSADFLLAGIANKYLPVGDREPVTHQHRVSSEEWLNLVTVAHENMSAAWQSFARLQLSVTGQADWSYRWHTSPYVVGYHRQIDARLHQSCPGSEVLTELYVPLVSLPDFMSDVRRDVLANKTKVLYSTVRFIAQDKESFLPWARHAYACVIFNLHAAHSPFELSTVGAALRNLINHAIKYDGSYYLTYHKFADKKQLLACYSQFPEYLAKKLKYDPHEVFQSDWYRHYKNLLETT
jgi:FAD/FMN-containing dehydrogenase